jgi:hypothetical protein
MHFIGTNIHWPKLVKNLFNTTTKDITYEKHGLFPDGGEGLADVCCFVFSSSVHYTLVYIRSELAFYHSSSNLSY